jgi:hypothetical protein
MNYEPKDYNLKLNIIKDIIEAANDISTIDFYSHIDSNVEGSDDIVGAIQKEVSNSASSAYKDSIWLKQELISDIENDLINQFNLYCFLVDKKVETEDVFPFASWGSTLNSIKENVHIEHKTILDGIEKILAVDKALGIDNFSSYLDFCRVREDQNYKFWNSIQSFINTNFPQIDIADILSGQNKTDFQKSLLGEEIQPGIKSLLFFKFAAYLPDTHWTFKEKTHNKGLKVSSSTSNFNEIFEEFKKTSTWGKISLSKTNQKLFITELLCGKREENQFYVQKQVGGYSSNAKKLPEDIKFDNCQAFFNQIIKGDVALAEFFVDKLSSLYFSKQVEKFSNELSQLINGAMHYKLKVELPQNNSSPKNKSKI